MIILLHAMDQCISVMSEFAAESMSILSSIPACRPRNPSAALLSFTL